MVVGCQPPWCLPTPLLATPKQGDDGTRLLLKRLVEPLAFDLFFRALAFAQLRGALFLAAPEPNPIFLRLGVSLGAPPLLAVLVEVDDHRL